jgi:hypothetical protein
MHELRSHPAVLFVLLFLAALGCRAVVRAANLRVRPSIGRGLVLVASLGMTLAYAALVVWYLREPAFFDHAEPTIPAVAAVFGAGKPLYPALDAPERYAHIYGPMLFLAQAAALALLGSSIVVWKIVGVLAILIGLVGSYAVFRRRADVHGALAGTAMCAVVFAAFDNASYWTRPDPLLVLCVVAGLLAAHARNHTASATGLGLVAGIAVNLKFTGPVYLLPVFAIALAEHGTRTVVTAALMAVPVAVAPFLLPNVSPAHYWDYLQLSARNGLVPAKIRQNAEWAAWLAAPLAAVVADAWKAVQVRRGAPAHLLALAASMAIVAVAASKPGGGPYHLLPFVPVLMYAFLWVAPPPFLTGTKKLLCAAFAASALFLALSDQAVIVRTVPARNLEETIAALGRFADQHPGRRIAVGYAGTSYLSHARPEMVFRTRDYLLDAPAVQEHRLSGLPLPESTIRAIDGCRVELWLIPQGAEAFAVPSAYAPDGLAEVFSEAFRRAFFTRHVRIGEAGGFDVWECRGGQAP